MFSPNLLLAPNTPPAAPPGAALQLISGETEGLVLDFTDNSFAVKRADPEPAPPPAE